MAELAPKRLDAGAGGNWDPEELARLENDRPPIVTQPPKSPERQHLDNIQATLAAAEKRFEETLAAPPRKRGRGEFPGPVDRMAEIGGLLHTINLLRAERDRLRVGMT